MTLATAGGRYVGKPSYVHNVHSPPSPSGHAKTARGQGGISNRVHVSNGISNLTRVREEKNTPRTMSNRRGIRNPIGHMDALSQSGVPSCGFSVSSQNSGEWTLWTFLREVIL